MITKAATGAAATIENFINSGKYRITVRPEPVEGLRQAQPERLGVMSYENVNEQPCYTPDSGANVAPL